LNKAAVFICSTLVLLTSLANIGIVSAGEDLEQDNFNPLLINLKAAQFDPLTKEPDIKWNLMYQSENNYYLVQCQGPIESDWVEKILDSGAIILGYIPQYTYLLYMENDVKNYIEHLHFIRWIGIYHPAYKIDSELLSLSGNVQLNIVVFRGNDGQKNLDLVRDRILAFGGTITREESNAFVIIAEIDSSRIADIAFIPEVEWIDQYFPPEPLMDNIRVFTGAESPLHDSGFTGTGIVG
jgi:hypothetical protein